MIFFFSLDILWWQYMFFFFSFPSKTDTIRTVSVAHTLHLPNLSGLPSSKRSITAAAPCHPFSSSWSLGRTGVGTSIVSREGRRATWGDVPAAEMAGLWGTRYREQRLLWSRRGCNLFHSWLCLSSFTLDSGLQRFHFQGFCQFTRSIFNNARQIFLLKWGHGNVQAETIKKHVFLNVNFMPSELSFCCVSAVFFLSGGKHR